MKTHHENPKGNVLFIFPDLDNPTIVFGARARPYGPPLGILYLATQLTHAGYFVKVVDFSAEPYHPSSLKSLLANTDVVGITALSYSRNHFHRLISEIRKFNENLPIMIGGPDCGIEASFAAMMDTSPRLPDGVDVMVIGEAEGRIVDIVDALMVERNEMQHCREERLTCLRRARACLRATHRQAVARQAGASHRQANCNSVIFRDKLTGEIRYGGTNQGTFALPKSCPSGQGAVHSQPENSSEFSQNLDKIPFPDFSLADRQAYTLFGLNKRGVGASIITSRGCPYKCSFCTRPAQHPFVSHSGEEKKQNHPLKTYIQIYRERSAENVLEEIQQLADAGYQVLYIVDDNFMVNEKRVHAIMDGIITRNIKMAILAQGRVYPCSETMYLKMREAGVQLLSYGLESGNQDVLDFYRKGTTIQQAQRALELADKCGIFTHGNFILGAPIETRAHIERTIQFAQELPLDAAFFTILNYTYGSELWDIAHAKGLIDVYESDVYADKNRGLGQFSQKELEQFCRKAHYRFYFRPTLWARYFSKLRQAKDKEFAKLLLRGFLRFCADVGKRAKWQGVDK